MRLLELSGSTLPGVPIRPPANEADAVPEAPAVDVSADDFTDNLRCHRLPDQVVLSTPPPVARHAAADEAALVVARLDTLMDVQARIATHSDPIWRERSNFIITAALEKGRWEQLWARQLGPQLFEICCIPFFAYDIALGDEVETAPADGKLYVVQRVVRPSGRHVFRVWFGEQRDEAIRNTVVRRLTDMGCQLEWSSENLVAVDAPNKRIATQTSEYLTGAQERVDLKFETAL